MDAGFSLPVYLNDHQVASWFGVPPQRVRKWVKQGTIPYRRLPDGTVVFDAAVLAQWVQTLPHSGEVRLPREVTLV